MRKRRYRAHRAQQNRKLLVFARNALRSTSRPSSVLSSSLALSGPSAATRARKSRSTGLIRSSCPSSVGENAICPARRKDSTSIARFDPGSQAATIPPRIPASAMHRQPCAPRQPFPGSPVTNHHPRSRPRAACESRRPSTAGCPRGRELGSPGSGPAITSTSRSTSRTVRAIGPTTPR